MNLRRAADLLPQKLRLAAVPPSSVHNWILNRLLTFNRTFIGLPLEMSSGHNQRPSVLSPAPAAAVLCSRGLGFATAFGRPPLSVLNY